MVDSLSKNAVNDLRQKGHDVKTIFQVWSKDPGDPAILDYANKDNRVLVTCDAGFGKLVFKDKMESKGVILYDQPIDNMKIADIVDTLSRSHQDEFSNGAVIKVDGDLSIRTSMPDRQAADRSSPILDLSRVDLPRYAETEHGYTVRPHSEGMCHLEKGGEHLRAQRDDQGSWSYENPRKDSDNGTIVDFVTRRGGSEAGIADYLKRNPDEARKAQEAQKATEDAREGR